MKFLCESMKVLDFLRLRKDNEHPLEKVKSILLWPEVLPFVTKKISLIPEIKAEKAQKAPPNGSFFLASQVIKAKSMIYLSFSFNASKYCGSVLKNDIVVVVVVVGVADELLSYFQLSDCFESLVETCPKRKIVVGAA